MDSNLLARIANPDGADPTAYLRGAQAGNALAGMSAAREGGNLLASGDLQGASGVALRAGQPQLATQFATASGDQSKAQMMQGLQQVTQAAQSPEAWDQFRQLGLSKGHDVGGIENAPKLIAAAQNMYAGVVDPNAAAGRAQSASQFQQSQAQQNSQFQQTLGKPVVVPPGSTFRNPATGETVGGPAAYGMGGGQGTGDDVLAGVDPQTAALVKKVAHYEVGLDALPRSGYQRQQILGLVSLYDPSFNAAVAPARAATVKSFMVGTDSQNITSLNTAIGHLGTLYDSIDGLNNTNTPVVGNLYNMGKNALYGGGGGEQAAAIQKFNQAAKAVGDELAKSFKGAGAAGEAEVAAWRKGLDAANSPDQLKAAISQGVELLRSRVESMQSKYQSAMGAPMKARMIDPSKAAVLTHMGIDPGELDPNYQPPQGGGDNGQGGKPPPTGKSLPPAEQSKVDLLRQRGVPEAQITAALQADGF